MKINFRQQLWMSFGIVFVAVAAASVGMYLLSNDLKAQADKIIFDKTLIAKQTAVLGILADLKNDAPRAAKYQVAMDRLLPLHDDLIGFPQWLNSLGRAHSVSVSFTFRGDNTPATESSPGMDGISISAMGSSANVIAFLNDIETQSAGFLLTIDTFDLANVSPDYRLTLQGRLFSRLSK